MPHACIAGPGIDPHLEAGEGYWEEGSVLQGRLWEKCGFFELLPKGEQWGETCSETRQLLNGRGSHSLGRYSCVRVSDGTMRTSAGRAGPWRERVLSTFCARVPVTSIRPFFSLCDLNS